MFIDAQQDELEPLDSCVVGLFFSSSSNGNDSFCSNRVGFAMAVLLSCSTGTNNDAIFSGSTFLTVTSFHDAQDDGVNSTLAFF
jgi:hypothetical protein